MKKLFYYYFTEYVIKNVIIQFLRLKGVKIGSKIIVLTAGYSNKVEQTDLRKGTIYGFHIVWVNSFKLGFDVEIRFDKEPKPYSRGFYPYMDFINLLNAQNWLSKQYPDLDDNIENHTYQHNNKSVSINKILSTRTYS